MKKVVLIALCFFSIYTFSSAQSSKITGLVTDSLGYSLINASVMLLEEDSTMIEFTQTNVEGKYSIPKVPYGTYLLKITYVGYIPITVPLTVDKKDIAVDKIVLNEINVQLMEVVVKAARAPLKMKGDTIEFDITQFKVPQNSTLEDLIKRLPGMEVEEGGAVKMDGKDVTSVKVDGKSFFGNNPAMATKNLPAEGVSTVQVYDRKSDEQKATNSDIPTNEKEMNVVLKDDFKNITFGKGTIGAGNLDRLEAKLSINKFMPLHQFSLIGVGNNTGRNGLGWDDREDFFGAQAYNFEELKYGFNNGFRFITYYEEDDINLDNKISELFWNNNNQGFPRNGLTGLNYNYETDKFKAGTRYVFNHKGNDMESFRSVNRFLPNNITNFDTTASNTISRGNVHKLEGNMSINLDSFNNIKLYFDYGNLQSDRTFNSNGASYRNVNDLISTSDISNIRDNIGSLSRGTILYNKTFKKKSRFFGLNTTYAVSDFTENTLNNSELNFTNQPLEDINQTFNNAANKTQIQLNATYNEPLSKRLFLNVFHNFDKSDQDGDIIVNDKIENRESVNTFLTRSYATKVAYNFTGTSLRYSHEGLNVSMGFGYQLTDLYGEFTGLSNNNGIVDTTFKNSQYFANVLYQISRNSNFSTSYTRSVNTPRISQLTPVINNANPLYIREGNPALQPEFSNTIFGNLWLNKPLSGFRFSIWTNISIRENAITQEEIVTESLITTTRPINYKDSRNINFGPNMSFPIIKNKLRASVNLQVNESQSYRLVNSIENKTQTFGIGPNATINITPGESFSLFLNARINQSKTTYSINTSQNQTILNQTYGATLSLKLAKALYLNSNYNHRFFKNDRFGQNTNIPIINASISKQFLKGNKGEIRLAAYDLLDKNRNFNIVAGNNTVSQSNTLALARYVMLQFSYNIKGLKAGINTANNDY
jgi:hypothetical protein